MILPKSRLGAITWDSASWWLGSTDKGKVAMFHCGSCNQNYAMLPYAIDKLGNVLPVLTCNCGRFSKEVTLADWNPTQWKVGNDNDIKSL